MRLPWDKVRRAGRVLLALHYNHPPQVFARGTFVSAKLDGGDAHNQRWLDHYRGRLMYLYGSVSRKRGWPVSSPDFQAFQFSCFDTSLGAVQNGLDVAALLRLAGPERAEAERLILAAIDSSLDWRPIKAAGYLKLAIAAEPLKRRLTSRLDDEGRADNWVHIAWALHQIEQYPQAAGVIISILQRQPRHNQWTRMMAVEALPDFGETTKTVTALLTALRDDDHYIGLRAADALKQVFAAQRPVIDHLNTLIILRTGPGSAAKFAEIETELLLVRALINARLLP